MSVFWFIYLAIGVVINFILFSAIDSLDKEEMYVFLGMNPEFNKILEVLYSNRFKDQVLVNLLLLLVIPLWPLIVISCMTDGNDDENHGNRLGTT